MDEIEKIYQDLGVFSSGLDNFEMGTLSARISETDSLIRTIHEQAEEISGLKNQLHSFNESAVQINRNYVLEMDKTTALERLRAEQLECIESMKAKLAAAENGFVNDRVLQNQHVADLENRLSNSSADLINVCKQFAAQWQILKENNLNNKILHIQYLKIVDILKKNGEFVENIKRTRKRLTKTCTVSTMTEVDECDQKPPSKPTFCDKATMHFQSTATRSTSTSTFIKKVSVGTNYPEPISIDEIFRRTIYVMPEMITAIDDFKWPTAESASQTDDVMPANRTDIATKDVGTVTRLKNVRQHINYSKSIKEQLLNSSASSRLCAIKKEEESPMGSMVNLAFLPTPLHTPALNPQLSELWTILGQTIFSIVGSGQTFSSGSSAMDMIQSNLNQIRTVVAREQEKEDTVQNTDTLISSSTSSEENIQDFTENNMLLHPHYLEDQFQEDVNAVEDIELEPAVISHRNSDLETLQPADTIPATPIFPDAACTVNLTATEPIIIARTEISTITTPSAEEDLKCGIPQSPMDPLLESASYQHDLNGMKSTDLTYRAMDETYQAQTSVHPVIELLPVKDSVFKVPNESTRRIGVKSKMNIKVIVPTSNEKCEDQHTQQSNHSIKAVETMSVRGGSKAIQVKRLQHKATDCNESIKRRKLQEFQTTATSSEDFDIAHISEYYQLPQLIQPILDIDINNYLFGSSGSDAEPVSSPPPIANEMLEIKEPASPERLSFSESEVDTLPQEIPTDTIVATSTSLIRKIIGNYSQRKRKAIELNAERHIECDNPKLYNNIRNVIEVYLSAEWTENAVLTCCSALLKLTRRSKCLVACLLEIIEDTDEPLETNGTPPAPALSVSHQRIILLVMQISNFLLGFTDFCIFQIERTLFTFTSGKSLLPQILNLTRLYIGLSDISSRHATRTKLFIYKCLYYFQHSSTPMVYATLMAYPDCLPILPDSRDNSVEHLMETFSQYDPLVQVLHIILMNTNYTTTAVLDNSQVEYRKREMLLLLKTYYRHPNVRLSVDFVVENLLERVKKNNLKNVSYSLILIAKRNGWLWARTKLIEPSLLELLKQYMSQINQTERFDAQIEMILFTIAAIVKTYPITEDITAVHQVFVAVLDGTPAHRQRVQEAAVDGLLKTSRFGVINVYDRICQWQPPFKISRKLMCEMQTFVHRKKLSFWK